MIKRLTSKQEQELPLFREEYLRWGLSTAPAGKRAAEAAIRALWARARKTTPPPITWCASPMTAEVLLNLLSNPQLRASLGASLWTSLGDSLRASLWTSLGTSLEASLGDSLRDSLRDSLWDSLGDSLRDLLGASLRDSLGDSLGTSLGDSLGTSLRDSLGDSLEASLGDSLRDSLWASLRASLGDSLRDSLWASLRASLGDSLRASGKLKYHATWFWGQSDLYWIAFYRFCEKIGVKYNAEDATLLRAHERLARNCGWVYFFEKRIFACDRPDRIEMSGTQLHSATGPAIRFRDGYGVWALHGVRVPRDVVETDGEKMDAGWLREHFLAEKNAQVRAEIARKVGAGLLCSRLGAREIESRDGYTLLLLDIGDHRARPYLRMRNPSVPTLEHIEGVHPDCDTISKALTWRNGTAERPRVLA